MGRLLCAIVLVVCQPLFALQASQYTAFSFKVAHEQGDRGALRDLGITHAVALIYDDAFDDIILVGKKEPAQTPITVDDWVVAVRAILANNQDPAVSIDRTEQTDTTRRQKVRFEGGLEDTEFGRDLLDADIVLKRLGLGTQSAETFGLLSYLDLSIDDYRKTGEQSKLVSRFWFHPDRGASYVTAKNGVVAVEQYKVGVTNEVMGSDENISVDQAAERFSTTFQSVFEDLKLYFPKLGRMEQLYYVTALAQGLETSGMSESALISYWLDDYQVNRVPIPQDYPLEENTRELAGVTLELSGGVSLDALVVDLQDGVADSMKKYTLSARPRQNSLSWDVPMMAFVWDTMYEDDKVDKLKAKGRGLDLGMSIERRIVPNTLPRMVSSQSTSNLRLTHSSLSIPATSNFLNNTSWQTRQMMPSRRIDPDYGRVGGVMLSGTASLSGTGPAQVDLSGGNFSFIVDGKNAKLSPEAFRKFVTALWVVYFSPTDPGISIDPICQPWRAPECKGIDKHLVRYIGKVINTDLGRVMRETDYIMKKWSVGTERPDFRDFRNPDDVAGETGNLTLAASRFWLEPKDLSFKQAGGALLFDQGRMTVQTEYLDDVKGRKADPGNEEFAKWFTRRYKDVAKRYPVYEDLFEYAKMVALAKYLKQQGVSLYWFLMANKDLVLTEDSPGTVDELAKGSEYFRGVEIRGGVKLGTTGQYVFDTAVEEEIRKLSQNLPEGRLTDQSTKSTTKRRDNGRHSTQPSAPDKLYSLEVGKRKYTVAPQHSLASGKDRRGIRYQNDLALRQNGEPSMEVVRFFDHRRREGGEFGRGWRLLIPYRLEPAGRATRRYAGAIIPERMFIENQVTGSKELLTFSQDRYSKPGWVPAFLKDSQVVGLFPFTDSTFRLVDKLGSEFHFDQSGYLTEMKLSRDHHVFFGYVDTIREAFEETPYLLRQKDEDLVEFQNALVPKRMEIVDLTNSKREMLVFGNQEGVVGYIPELGEDSRYEFLALLSDTSYQLKDSHGNIVSFGPDGRFRGMGLAEGKRIIERMRQGNQTIEFQYTLSPDGLPIISGAHLVGSRDFVVWYWYGPEGNLTRVSHGPDRIEPNQHAVSLLQ